MSSGDENGDDPLEELLVDKNEINRERLARVLRGLVGIDSESGELVIQPAFHELDSRAQMVALLLGKRAALNLGVIEDGQLSMSSSEIADYVDVSGRSIRTYGKDKLSFVSSDDSRGGYFIPTAALTQGIKYIEDAKGGN